MRKLTPALLEFKRLLEQLPALRTVAQRIKLLRLRQDLFRREVEILAQRLVERSISLANWQAQMAVAIKDLHITAAVIAKGGDWGLMTQADWGYVGSQCKKQYRFLHGFAQDILARVEAGKDLTTAIHVRAKMYGGAGSETLFRFIQMEAEAEGKTEVSWNLTPAEHCDDCLTLGAVGWIPLAKLSQFPGDGTTQCLTNCKCYLDYR